MNRRDLYRIGTFALGGLAALALAVPGVAYILDPLRKMQGKGRLRPMAKLSELKVGVPVAVAVNEERQDAWVKYPKEPVGSVWLLRQPEGSKEPVVAFTSRCPHLGCAINLSADHKSFYCACHSSSFSFDGTPQNNVPPRAMDKLEVEITKSSDPEVRVKFQRFRSGTEERIPLA